MDIAKLFKNGRSQAVRLPKKYRFDDSEVLINKVGEFVVLIPKDKTWENLENSVLHFSDDFMKNRNQPEIQER
ncbi:MAG: AbrB/MazE/SpoVT family DNA-binding domain-containing protein [Candidatus Cloacimonetes bacterium]|nr:AbrB/MazE/SpoVT family DNA-binding domain-containing protein [Candidatus Cloacimonadota bacterium]MBS3767983.1 AbrB/MazE/SpoVT family DNA-binding domain-containing protein [Candidatus Cloacimonadota bacterium]